MSPDPQEINNVSTFVFFVFPAHPLSSSHAFFRPRIRRAKAKARCLVDLTPVLLGNEQLPCNRVLQPNTDRGPPKTDTLKSHLNQENNTHSASPPSMSKSRGPNQAKQKTCLPCCAPIDNTNLKRMPVKHRWCSCGNLMRSTSPSPSLKQRHKQLQ